MPAVDVFNDAGLVHNGPHGSYVLAICTQGAGWQLVAEISRTVWQFESSR
jgi:hypothetical protein